MKKIISTILVVFALLTSFLSIAQNQVRQPRLHERIVQAKLGEIKRQLKLDEAAYQQFRPIYFKYEWAISGIDFRKLARLMKSNPDSLSTEEADQLISDQLQQAKKLIEIREKYYKEFRTVLSPQQIIQLYQTEAELRKKVMNEIKRRMISR
jgi:hypothetical protein